MWKGHEFVITFNLWYYIVRKNVCYINFNCITYIINQIVFSLQIGNTRFKYKKYFVYKMYKNIKNNFDVLLLKFGLKKLLNWIDKAYIEIVLRFIIWLKKY